MLSQYYCNFTVSQFLKLSRHSSDFSKGRNSELFFRLLYFNFFVRFFVGAWIRHFINDSIVYYTFSHYPVRRDSTIEYSKTKAMFWLCHRNYTKVNIICCM